MQRGSQGGKGTYYVPRPPLIAKSILGKERERNLKSIISLKEPSFETTTRFKIEGACVF
jgi:hypothetical protein